jgi:hypothetical protein
LVHLNVVGVKTLENLGEDPSVGEVALGVCDLVGEVKRLDPLKELAGEGGRGRVDGEGYVTAHF